MAIAVLSGLGLVITILILAILCFCSKIRKRKNAQKPGPLTIVHNKGSKPEAKIEDVVVADLELKLPER